MKWLILLCFLSLAKIFCGDAHAARSYGGAVFPSCTKLVVLSPYSAEYIGIFNVASDCQGMGSLFKPLNLSISYWRFQSSIQFDAAVPANSSFGKILFKASEHERSRSFVDKNCTNYHNPFGRSLTAVYGRNSCNRLSIFVAELAFFREQISSQFMPSRLASNFDRLYSRFYGGPISGEGLSNKNYTNTSYYDAEPCGYSGNFSPVCHLPLGLKVALGAPFLALGIWLSVWLIDVIERRKPNAWRDSMSVLAILVGAAIATCGIALIVL